MRGRVARTGAALLVLALAGCGSRDGGEPTVNASTAEASANAPLAPSPSAGLRRP